MKINIQKRTGNKLKNFTIRKKSKKVRLSPITKINITISKNNSSKASKKNSKKEKINKNKRRSKQRNDYNLPFAFISSDKKLS